MNYEITKLDKRHSWHDQFQYMIEFKRARDRTYFGSGFLNNTGVLEFDRSRRWFNETYGWSQDVETRASIGKLNAKANEDYSKDFNVHWSYSIKYNEYRLYVNTDRELNWFVLTHPKTDV